MSTSAQKNQKTSGNLGNFYINDWKNGESVGADTLYLKSRHFQGSNWDLARLKKQSQRNELGFCLSTRFYNLKN